MSDERFNQTVYAARAAMIDGSVLDLLLFAREKDAADHVAYIKEHCQRLGFDSVTVAKRLVIGADRRQS